MADDLEEFAAAPLIRNCRLSIGCLRALWAPPGRYKDLRDFIRPFRLDMPLKSLLRPLGASQVFKGFISRVRA